MFDILEFLQNFFSKFFTSNSNAASSINTLFINFLILSAIIMFIVAGGVIFAAIRYRAKVRPDIPRQIFGNKKIEVIWTVLPLLTLIFFFILTVNSMESIDKPFPKNQQPDIIITAHQWWWDIRYPKYNFTTANELHIPIRKKLLARIQSEDVIHDWWVPDLGRKIDAIPGDTNYTWIDANNVGDYEGACSEYCGAQHARMRIKVIAQTQDEFNKWINEQQKIPTPPSNNLTEKGRELFQQKTCANCHAISGTFADKHIGPDLTHLASRQTILSGMLTNNEQNLTRWLSDPQKVKEGAHMPNFIFSNDEIQSLVIYLESLK